MRSGFFRHGLVGVALAGLLLGCAALPPQSPPSLPGVARSVPALEKKDGGVFLRKHAACLQQTQRGDVELLFLGDSITEGWAKQPALWQKHYGAWRTANCGVGGDRVEHVLWRLDHGLLAQTRPRVVVLMIGTNNSASQGADYIVAGIQDILATLQAGSPQSRVLLLGVLPRGPRRNADGSMDDGLRRMEVIRAVNARLAQLDDGQRLRYLDIGERFLVEGRIPPELMPDQLHPGTRGYAIWADAMQGLLDEMMAQTR
ncbi:GDSL-type esterase/lipase family protein [Uliginosibacterium sp. 31-12]|uniref:GDSL-type esterase/lipase family protein n=1 Tax=Uliginosibacterium sp. 31-12 TaxID=3062781 RepID=UPI0026E2674D|nr:GDSL-type esterase/lipase family protein [Uliginosibacterium sp. 31-12]MDO6387327.1 GDSL-type esterase/lipase family protein [Uliginosibacterium sp. 31-12]